MPLRLPCLCLGFFVPEPEETHFAVRIDGSTNDSQNEDI